MHGRTVILFVDQAYHCWDVPGVASSLAALCTDNVYASCTSFMHMLRVAHHVHDQDVCLVQLFNHPRLRNTHC